MKWKKSGNSRAKEEKIEDEDKRKNGYNHEKMGINNQEKRKSKALMMSIVQEALQEEHDWFW